MLAAVEHSAYGTHLPTGIVRRLIAITRQLPANWAGLRLSMPLRRIAILALGEKPVDTTVWSMRARFYPQRNACEKNALFTPQLFDCAERVLIAAAIDRNLAAGRDFTFVDVGANVGLHSLFVAARAGKSARILAIEPQPGIADRLAFNLAINPTAPITLARVAVADHDGELALVIDPRDSGGTHLLRPGEIASATTKVRCRTLIGMVHDAGFKTIDALKIDVEGAEDLALVPFMDQAADDLLPGLILIEDRPDDWAVDLYGLFRSRGYTIAGRGQQNLLFRRIKPN